MTVPNANSTHEVHVERILGRHVHDVDGHVIGRLEEIAAERDGDDCVVTEFHVGPAATIERIARFVRQLPLIGLVPFSRWEYRIPWQLFDLSNPDALRVRCRRDELRRVPPRHDDSSH
jgi:sporulation protein YlmC with PRC-barrel domain